MGWLKEGFKFWDLKGGLVLRGRAGFGLEDVLVLGQTIG